jgi:hypothetical protein
LRAITKFRLWKGAPDPGVGGKTESSVEAFPLLGPGDEERNSPERKKRKGDAQMQERESMTVNVS